MLIRIGNVCRLPPAVKRLSDPQPYPLRLETRLAELKSRLIRRARACAG